MPRIKSTELQVNQPVESAAPDAVLTITMEQPLKVGAYTFQLEVIDNSGNRSAPVQARLFVIDNAAPTAIISAPRTVAFGAEFTLSGGESRDTGGGTIERFIWTLLQ